MKHRIAGDVEPPVTTTLNDLIVSSMTATVRLSLALHAKPHRFREACTVLSEIIASHPLVSVTLAGIGHTNDLISVTVCVSVGNPTEIRHRDSRSVAALILLDDLVTSMNDFAPCFVDDIDPGSDEALRAARVLRDHGDNDLPHAVISMLSKGTARD